MPSLSIPVSTFFLWQLVNRCFVIISKNDFFPYAVQRFLAKYFLKLNASFSFCELLIMQGPECGSSRSRWCVVVASLVDFSFMTTCLLRHFHIVCLKPDVGVNVVLWGVKCTVEALIPTLKFSTRAEPNRRKYRRNLCTFPIMWNHRLHTLRNCVPSLGQCGVNIWTFG